MADPTSTPDETRRARGTPDEQLASLESASGAGGGTDMGAVTAGDSSAITAVTSGDKGDKEGPQQ